MKHITDAIAAIIIMAIAIHLLIGLITPYVPWLAIALALYMFGKWAYHNTHRW